MLEMLGALRSKQVPAVMQLLVSGVQANTRQHKDVRGQAVKASEEEEGFCALAKYLRAI